MAAPQPVARRQRLDPDERRRQILDAARTLFSERHYGTVALDHVADAAGITRGLLHHYFGTKRELYLAVVRTMFRDGAPPVPEFVRDVTPEQRLADSIDRWLATAERNRETWLAMLGAEGLGRDPELEAILDRVRERAVDNVIAILGIGPASDVGPEARAVLRAYGSLAEGATQEWLERGRLTRHQVHTFLTQTLVRLVDDVLPLVMAAGSIQTGDTHAEQ